MATMPRSRGCCCCEPGCMPSAGGAPACGGRCCGGAGCRAAAIGPPAASRRVGKSMVAAASVACCWLKLKLDALSLTVPRRSPSLGGRRRGASRRAAAVCWRTERWSVRGRQTRRGGCAVRTATSDGRISLRRLLYRSCRAACGSAASVVAQPLRDNSELRAARALFASTAVSACASAARSRACQHVAAALRARAPGVRRRWRAARPQRRRAPRRRAAAPTAAAHRPAPPPRATARRIRQRRALRTAQGARASALTLCCAYLV